jgi:flagellar basal-body rod protein FlgG
MVTQDGYLIQPAITIPTNATDVSISKTGQVQVTVPGATTPTVAGNIELATFVNQAGLSAQGSNLFTETAASGAPTVGAPGSEGVGTLVQGYTEASNVDPVSEITALIVAQRAYEMNSKVISTADNMLGVTNQLKS